jgi:hypothetical protein
MIRSLVSTALIFLAASPAFPCTVFCISDGKNAFAGNNEDYFDPATRMWFVPGEKGRHGRVYFGFANGFPQGGMNDAGLFFDGLALDREEVSSELPAFDGNLSDRAMAECASVEEVVALFEKYDRDFLAQAQLLFADRTGDAAVIEGNAIVRKKGRYLTSTNFRASKTARSTPAACDRYRISSRMLAGEGEVTVDLCRRVLAATHQEAPAATLYSNVCDLTRGKVHLYHFHDYANPVVVDLAAELAKGAHSVEISSLFPENYAFIAFRQRAEDDVARQKEREGVQDVDRSAFGDFAGRYRFRDGPAAGMEVVIKLDDGKLFAELPQGGRFELTPKGGTSFVCISTSLHADVSFDREGKGPVTGLTVNAGGLKVSAEKVASSGAGKPAKAG